MILISSFRPFGEDPEWDSNQLRAFRSWCMFAKHIYLFSQPNELLRSEKVSFVPCEEFPRIKDMVAFAAKHRRDTSLICNGDIMIDPAIMKIERKLGISHAACASSRRWNFTPQPMMSDAIKNATLEDRGRDVFMAKPQVWIRIANEMPDAYRIGHNLFDGYLTHKFREHWDKKFLDFTAMRIVFHPIHGGRRRPYDHEIAEAVK